MKRTSLYEEHLRAGARMVEFAGWEMPVQYSGIVDEHRRVRTAAGLFDVSHMGEIEITGPQGEACCARLLANDVRRLAPGSVRGGPAVAPVRMLMGASGRISVFDVVLDIVTRTGRVWLAELTRPLE